MEMCEESMFRKALQKFAQVDGNCEPLRVESILCYPLDCSKKLLDISCSKGRDSFENLHLIFFV